MKEYSGESSRAFRRPVGSSFNSAAVAVLFVLPVKLAFDVLGHFHEHGMLAFGEVESDPVQS